MPSRSYPSSSSIASATLQSPSGKDQLLIHLAGDRVKE
jgi:hypothetical protein